MKIVISTSLHQMLELQKSLQHQDNPLGWGIGPGIVYWTSHQGYACKRNAEVKNFGNFIKLQ